MNLLIIDDDELVAGYFKRISSKIGGLNVYTAHTPIAIDKILRAHEFDCVLCDIHLGHGETGPEILISNRTLLTNTTIHLISCSDNISLYSDMLRNYGLNIGLCLQKPVEPKLLIEFLKEHCK